MTATRQLIHYVHLLPLIRLLILAAVKSEFELTMALCKKVFHLFFRHLDILVPLNRNF